MQTEYSVFIYLGMCMNIYVTIIKEKEIMNLRESKGREYTEELGSGGREEGDDVSIL